MKYLSAMILMFASTMHSQEFTKAIEDNSYFIEEAYNQEDRVVQHIFNGASFTKGNILESSFTQEWPAFGRSHQLSLTIPHFSQSSPSAQGIGDIMVNYRYQAVDEPGLAVSPRFSLLLPTGDNTKGFGSGVTGMQFNLPVSKRFTNEMVTHYNAGFTLLPEATFTAGKATVTEYFAGISGIYLATKSFNVMMEMLYANSGSTYGRTDELIVSPGMRWAIDIGDLQIVPGIAFPFAFSSGQQNNGILFYTSFEHFF